jgi:hypothetical protein
MILNRTWQQFYNAAENKNLTMEQAKRKYSDERKRYEQHQQFVNSGLYIQGLK